MLSTYTYMLWFRMRTHDVLRRAADERGASLVEYALLVALIAMVCIGAVTFFGTSTGDSISRAGNSVGAAN